MHIQPEISPFTDPNDWPGEKLVENDTEKKF